MHSLLGECQGKCNLIVEPRLVNTSFVGTACSVHRGGAHCQNLKAFSFILFYKFYLFFCSRLLKYRYVSLVILTGSAFVLVVMFGQYLFKIYFC